MARPLRIEYPGAWYHVMNRGRRAEKIFHDKQDYGNFVELLEDTSQRWNLRVAAYCLMANHYHILVQTPDANIARSMRHINGIYTQKFNRRHRCDGQLFRGRYKSILVNGDSYLLQLVRYIHRNPVRVGLASRLEDYIWSSHTGFLSVAKRWDWLYKEFIFSLLSKRKKEWMKAYCHFVSLEDDEGITTVLEGNKWPSLLGPKSFVDWVKGRYYEMKTDEDIPQAKDLAPVPELIIEAVCDYYQINRKDLYKSKRGEFNEARNVAVFLMRRLRYDSLKEIGSYFQMLKYSSVSSSIERMKKQLSEDRNLKKRVRKLSAQIFKSQEQT